MAWIFLSKWQLCCKPEVHRIPANVPADPLLSLYWWQERGVAVPSRFLLEGNHSVQGCCTVFNGLIALEKAATGNAVWGGGGYHLETLLATRESQRISLMGGVSDVGYFLFSIAPRFFFCVCPPSAPTFAPSPSHHISLSPPPVVNYTKSHITGSLLGK